MRKFMYLIVGVLSSIMFVGNVSAASGSITASTSAKTVVVGSTFTVTVKASCSSTIGSWQFGISYDNSVISLQSGDTSVADVGDGKIKSKTYTYKFKAIKAGSAGVRVVGASMVPWDDINNIFTPSVSNVTVNVKTQAQIEASYSKDNTLKSLSVSGYELSPKFDKNTTSYSLDVPDTVTSIKVSASVNDKNASVRGVGNIDVSEGSNKINVVVTAQNGSTKTYTIVVNVADQHPISVTIDGEKYLVVKKSDLLTSPTGFTPTTIKIDEVDVPAFSNELANITLVGLKNSEGNIYLYKYEDNGYQLYNEIKSSSLVLYPESSDEIPDGFKSTKVTINEVEYDGYKKGNDIIIYAINIETGKKAFYKYDNEDNVFIKYISENGEVLISESNDDANIYIYALSGISLLLLIISISLGVKNSKLKSLLERLSENMKVEE